MNQGDGMAEVTEADREKAREVVLKWTRSDLDVMKLSEDLAAALAEEREKARAPFLALAEELEREGQNEEAEAKKLGKSVTAESWWGSGAASLDAAARIRRAAEVTL